MTRKASRGALGIVTDRDVAVPMRDDVVLRATVFRPEAEGQFPGILLRTPYCKPESGYERYVRAGYAVVTQDSRGRYASNGEWIPFTVENTGDAEDGYDSVEWLAAQPWCDGRVGTLGASYNAWMQWQLAKLRPPHLVAMCAYTIPLEITAVDWTGGFRPGRRIKWWLTSMAPDLRRRHGLPEPHTPEQARQQWDEVAGEGHWIGYLPWHDFPRHLPPGLAEYAVDWLENPSRRAWRFDEVHKEVEVPNLDVSGWFDHCNDSMRHLTLMQRNAATETARTQTKLVAGPWNHPGLGKRNIAGIDFGPEAEVDLTDLIVRWFDHWLKGIDNGVDKDSPVRYFVMGSGQWRHSEAWPPAAKDLVWYLSSGGSAGRACGDGQLCETPTESGGTDTFTYDPRNPVPTLWTKEWFTGPGDRRRLEGRTDILYYRSEPLNQPVELAGYPQVVMHVSTTAADTDFFARLVDEEPDGEEGRALEVSYGMVRLRHRNGLDRDDPVPAGEWVEVRIEMSPTACCFQPGHRIRLEITSSDFPNHDRNHNTGGDDLREVELVTAQQSVHWGDASDSCLILPVPDNRG
ncbi:MAG: CocE/NonD family hydrolase [Candidatus Latescibacterota bacterium]|nr:CocE/NonD family hydrolase [Candidatus Latescibacterota bacterium]